MAMAAAWVAMGTRVRFPPAPSSSCAAARRPGTASTRGAAVCGAAASGRDAAAAKRFAAEVNPLVAGLRPSATVAMTDRARELKEAGEDVIGLSAGEPDFDTPEPIARAGQQAIADGFTRYSPNNGTAALRRAVVDKLARDNGLEYTADEVVLSNGAKQSVSQAVLAFCGPGDEVIVPTPYWVSYPEMVALSGAESVILPTSMDDGFKVTAARLEAALTPRSRMLILCSPSNPSGAVYSEEELGAIASVVAAHPRLLVLSDEIYERIVYPPAVHVSIAGFPGMWERTLLVNGFSKAYAMTGWRLGYLAAPKPLAAVCNRLQSQTTSGASSIAQQAALAAFGPDTEALVVDMVHAFERRRDYVVARLRSMPGVRMDVVPDGAFYALPDISTVFGKARPDTGTTLRNSNDLAMYLLEDAKLALVPGGAFGNDDCIRISYAAADDVLKAALDRMEAALAKLT